ncbi:MAG TPA: IPT/TIG domain-containing protein [Thermoanaerobaculia bacterium]|nr:IPT/TIG domain-containing protein [Thermoanaerobaculia bacterium]
MNKLRQQKYLFALLALLVVFAGCKGESPTAPPITPPGGGGGGGTPPAGARIVITVANPTPLTDSSTAITATVTVNGNPVPAGTAVEFGTTLGRFEDSGTNTSLRTTNAQGQATVSLTSATAGTANVTVVVNNAIERTTVTFSARPTTPTPPTTAATITAVNPNIGRVEGGDLVTITGTNFRQPVRVFFDVNGTLREAQVVSVTPTQIQILTPRVELASGQTLDAPIVLFIEQGTPNEQRVTSSSPFTFRRSQLTPVVTTLSPPSGPLEGGTQTTIIGSGFESFVQVFFGLAEAQVVNVTFDKIVVVSPPARDTTPDANPIAGQVPVRIVNVNSGTETVFSTGFRYHSAMQIIAVGPTRGPFTGGTRVTIDGVGFDDPVAVTIGGFAAQVIRVTGTQIIAQTVGIPVTGCADVKGGIAVTNISTGLSAEAGDVQFTYEVPDPIVISATNPVVRGGVISVRVFNAFGFARLRLGTNTLNITSEVQNADGTTTFTAVVPPNLELDTETCAGVSGVTAPQPTPFDVTYESATTGCTDTMTNATTVEPQPTPRLTLSPSTFTPFTATINPGNPAAVPPVPPSTTPSAPQSVNIVSNGGAPLTITSITDNCAAAGFVVAYPTTFPITMQQCEITPITARYNGTLVPGTQTCTVIVNSDAGTRTLTLTGTSQ